MKKVLGEAKSKQLLFVHAMGICSTTSQLCNVIKAHLFNKLGDEKFVSLANVFCCPDSTHENIFKTGNETMTIIYNGKENESLNQLRYRKFNEKAQRVATKSSCKTLPPTEASAKFHYLRVYLQMQGWMDQKLNPVKFGWFQKSTTLRPIATNLPAAPIDILSKIRCGCKGECDSNRCSCFCAGFKCTSACKACK